MNLCELPGTVESSFPGSKDGVSLVRCWLGAWLEKFGVAGPAADDALLVVSELATNAAVHSRSSGPYGFYLVRLRRGVSSLRLEVADAGGESEPRARRSGGPGIGGPEPCGAQALTDTIAEGGHGLALVEAFTTRWWIRGDEQGRTVGAEIALDGAG